MPLSQTTRNFQRFQIFSFFLLLIFVSCGEQSGTPPGDDPGQQEMVNAPEGIITLEEARIDCELYSKRRAPLIRQYEDSLLRAEGVDSAFAVARYVAFDYANLKQYMQYIEQEAQKAGTDISSLRVYFGNNPESGGHVHPRQNTVFLVPAAQPDKERDEQFGIYIRPDGTAGYLSLDLQPVKGQGSGMDQDGMERSEAAFLSLPTAPATLQDGGSLIMNFGGSAPPPHN